MNRTYMYEFNNIKDTFHSQENPRLHREPGHAWNQFDLEIKCFIFPFYLNPIFPCLILQHTRTQRRLVMITPRLRVNIANPGILMSVSSSPSSAISSDSNFSSGLSVVVVVVAGGLLVVVLLVVEVTLEAGLAVAWATGG